MIDASTASLPPLVSFNAPLNDGETYRPPADRILSGDPVQTVWELFTSEDGRFHSGIWESKPGKWRCIFSESEFCHILSGVLVVVGDDGQTATYRAGDAFLSPAGFTGTWEVVETVRKQYAFYE
jgi:uncharacterized cupin superfamily protein